MPDVHELHSTVATWGLSIHPKLMLKVKVS